MPNITGHATVNICTTLTDSGALYLTDDSSGISIRTPDWGSTFHKPLIPVDASRSSRIYGSSNTVTPMSLTTLLLIKY